jgi:hypothetical protein
LSSFLAFLLLFGSANILIITSCSVHPAVEGDAYRIHDSTIVSKAAADLSNKFKKTYQPELRSNSSLKEDLKVGFTITPEGSVCNLNILENTLADRTICDTILKYISHWKFDAIGRKDSVKVIYPFRFMPH